MSNKDTLTAKEKAVLRRALQWYSCSADLDELAKNERVLVALEAKLS